VNARVYFTVSRQGYALDNTRFEYKLPPGLDERLERGDRISMEPQDVPEGSEIVLKRTQADPTGIAYIFIETGKFAEQVERNEFESVGPPSSGSWTPQTGNPSYASGAKPDSGRFFGNR
jgi:hypothetical protein